MRDSRPLLLATDFPPINRGVLNALQANLGYRCNLSCVHCHVNAGPTRKELMDLDTVNLLLDFIERHNIQLLDLTGGAPELNPHFRYLVTKAREMGVEVIDRCNLTILFEPGQEDLADFLVEQQVVITASLPCYLEENVEAQRGKGVFVQSIEAIKKLNALGYGVDERLPLHLVYNPIGAVLPPPQQSLEADYKRELKARYGVLFNQLFTIANMPINRFGSVLMAKGEFEAYMTLLKNNFNAGNLATLMCRNLISVDWQGFVYDCDFNQMLDMPLLATDRSKPHLSSLMLNEFDGHPVAIGDHCFACTAGQGSSCGGALNE